MKAVNSRTRYFSVHKNEYKENKNNNQHFVYVISLDDEIKPIEINKIQQLIKKLKALN